MIKHYKTLVRPWLIVVIGVTLHFVLNASRVSALATPLYPNIIANIISTCSAPRVPQQQVSSSGVTSMTVRTVLTILAVAVILLILELMVRSGRFHKLLKSGLIPIAGLAVAGLGLWFIWPISKSPSNTNSSQSISACDAAMFLIQCQATSFVEGHKGNVLELKDGRTFQFYDHFVPGVSYSDWINVARGASDNCGYYIRYSME